MIQALEQPIDVSSDAPAVAVRPLDEELVAASQRGDVAAFEKLFELHRTAVFSAVWRIVRDRELAEDITQDTFLKVFTRLGQLRDGASFRSWLHRVATNLALNQWRRTRVLATEEEAIESGDWRRDPYVAVARAQARDLFRAAMERLSPRYRRVLALRLVHELDYPELARRLDVTPSNAHVLVFRAKARLRQEYRKLLAERPAGGPCLSVNRLHRLLEGRVTGVDREQLEAHVLTCPICSGVAEEWRGAAQAF
ncbi:MAG: RNA polymerase sigma factor [Candidatus Dormibacteria bacterium]